MASPHIRRSLLVSVWLQEEGGLCLLLCVALGLDRSLILAGLVLILRHTFQLVLRTQISSWAGEGSNHSFDVATNLRPV